MDISKLSKAELVKNNEKLVQEFLIKQGYEVIKVLGDKVQTKYKIYKDNQSYTIKWGIVIMINLVVITLG